MTKQVKEFIVFYSDLEPSHSGANTTAVEDKGEKNKHLPLYYQFGTVKTHISQKEALENKNIDTALKGVEEIKIGLKNLGKGVGTVPPINSKLFDQMGMILLTFEEYIDGTL